METAALVHPILWFFMKKDGHENGWDPTSGASASLLKETTGLSMSVDTKMPTDQSIVAGIKPGSAKAAAKRAGWFMCAPLIVALITIGLYPGIYMMASAFSKSTMARQFIKNVGWSNIEYALTGDYVWSMFSTLVFAIPASMIQMVLGVAIALLLVRITRFASIWRSLIFIPMMTPPIMIGIAWKLMLLPTGGFVNGLFVGAGVFSEPVSFLGQMPYAMFSLIIADTWQWTPFVALLSYAAIKSLPDDIRQAAYMDGASPTRTFFSVELPLLMPALLGIFLIKLILGFKVFDIVYILTQGGPGIGTNLASYSIYRTLVQTYDVGYAGAQVLLLVILITLVTLPIMSLHRKMSEHTEA